MATYNTRQLSDDDNAPTVTGYYGRCSVCGVEWQIKGDSDKDACPWCGAGKKAVAVLSEKNRQS